jgi:uncharacterized protein (TIGR03085 family)
MGAPELLRDERAALCATFDDVGPTAPTLCEGWDTSDLAAHLLVRETRPDAGLGIVLPGPFARHTANVMEHVKRRGYGAMVSALRSGPPWLFRTGPMAAANVVENWIHHEDVRRARGDGPRPSSDDLDALLWRSLGFSGRIAGRRVKGAGLELRTPAGQSRVLSAHEPKVTLTGEPGELVLFLSGRKDAAAVKHEGPPEAVAAVLSARLGL